MKLDVLLFIKEDQPGLFIVRGHVRPGLAQLIEEDRTGSETKTTGWQVVGRDEERCRKEILSDIAKELGTDDFDLRIERFDYDFVRKNFHSRPFA